MRNFVITVDGKAYQVEVEEIIGGAAVPAAQTAPIAAAPKPAAPALAAVKPASAPVAPKAAPATIAADGVKINAPLPGMIVSLKVPNGATVKKGQTILIIEAMKMENDIASPADGVITFVVSQGQNVAQNQLLAAVK
ncbi:MAG: biotin/lipoyl-binding protein [Clostridiales bacterium]|jgi:biotin carboxyl carrier protein|nr:biotin/lipoyl-binding protein [Clostridiales bacterium]